MAIKKMDFVRISGPSSKIDRIISDCCSTGYFQVENADEYVSKTMGYTSFREESPYAGILQSVRELAETYGFDLSPGKSKKSKKAKIDEHTTEYIDKIAHELNDLNEELKELNDQYDECSSAIDKYSHFVGLDTSLDDIFHMKFISLKFGYLPKEGYIKFMKGYEDNPYILFYTCSTDAHGYWGAYFSPRDKADEVDRIFAALQFERLYIPEAAGTAEEIVENLKKNMDKVSAEKEKIDKKVQSILKSESLTVKSLYLRLLDLNQIYELRKFAVCHGKSCFFVGWIPEQYEKEFQEKFSRYSDFLIEIEKPEEMKNVTPPTRLKNWIFFRPFEYFVEMYGLPSYKDIDITAFVAVTYTLLFGIMFGDLGQGLVLALIGFIAWKKKRSGLGKILIPCGVSSAFFGLMFGSVFGFENVLDPVYHAVGMKGKPLEVMDSINTVLLLAIGIGVALVAVAMLLNVIGCFKRKQIGSALFSENGITGICTYAGGASLIYTFMTDKEIIPTGAAAALLAVGMIILFNKEIIAGSIDRGSFQKPESVSDYLMQNIFECVEYALSYFSNTLSFLRVGAFVIVHASMMMVVFTLAGNPATVKGMIIILIGNIVVIALEGLLTGIQGLRLEFYEMFSRFYEGSGRPFKAEKLASAALNKR